MGYRPAIRMSQSCETHLITDGCAPQVSPLRFLFTSWLEVWCEHIGPDRRSFPRTVASYPILSRRGLSKQISALSFRNESVHYDIFPMFGAIVKCLPGGLC